MAPRSQIRQADLGTDQGSLGFAFPPKAVREVAILVTGAKFRSAYALYAHVIAAEKRGLAHDKLATIC